LQAGDQRLGASATNRTDLRCSLRSRFLEEVASGYRASKIIGYPVVNDANETVGKVDDIILGTDRMPYVIMSVGGFLGVGDKLVVLPYEALKTNGSKLTMPGATKEALKALPEFKYTSR
jgi:hypothetical protein